MATRVLIIEASSGGVVGGSLTGLIHLIRGLDRSRFAPAIALYEHKTVEAELEQLEVPVRHVERRRIPKQHPLLHTRGYREVRRVGFIRGGLRGLRQTLRLLAEELPAALRLARIIRELGADVLHLGNGVRANFDAILAGWMTRTPIVCHVKGFEKYGGRERWAARRLDALVLMTEAIATHCRDAGVVARHNQVIYDAVDLDWLEARKSRGEVRASLGIGGDVPLVAISGNIQEWKGQLVLVEALGRLRDSNPDVQCVILGGVHRAGEAYAQHLRQRIAELGLVERVHFLGFRDDVPDLVNAVDIVVHASIRPEPFGRVILEGMLAGKLVIASDAGGVRELIDDGRTGFLATPGDDAELAESLARALADPPAAAALGAAARREAQQRFSLSRHVEEMCGVYERAMKGNGGV